MTAKHGDTWKSNGMTYPDECLATHEVVIATQDREFVVSPKTSIDGRAKFTGSEMLLLGQATPGRLPDELTAALHSVKRILGGEVVLCKER